MSLSPQFLDEIRARTTLSTLIGKSVKLTKAGREYKACCPFHNEKSPSFYVNDDKGFYHCFGCSAHGDAIRFLTESQGLPFIDAVKELAAAAGMEMPAPDPRAAERHERELGLHEVTGAAERWFIEQLGGIDGAEARAYLKRRGIDEALQKAFGIGFAPDSRGRLKAALKQYGDGPLVETGMLISVEGKEPYDRFRVRVMIPIRDQRGRTIAFGGRILDTGEPKYLNSPETPLFDKGRSLFNIDRAGPASRKANRVVVVEGYMDVIALAKAGIDEAVAPLGTALTEGQMERLWRLADAPILCFDGDKAGQKAALRAAERALPVMAVGKTLRFALLPAGKDPDDVVKEGGRAAIETVLSAPKPLMRLLYDSQVSTIDATNPEERAGVRHHLNTLAGSFADKLLQDEYRRSFNDLFFDDFGWKKRDREAVGEAVRLSGPRGNIRLYHSLARSALYGFFRFPRLIVDSADALYRVDFGDDLLKRWRDRIVNAVIDRPELEYDGVKSILEASDLAKALQHDMRRDLRFPWIIDPNGATDRLTTLVRFLVEEQELAAELDRLNRRAIEDTGLDDYAIIEELRAEIRHRMQLLREHGYQLGSGEPAAANG